MLWHVYTISKHLVTLKIKNYSDVTVFKTILYNEKVRFTGVFLWIKDSDPDPVFSRIRIRNTAINYNIPRYLS